MNGVVFHTSTRTTAHIAVSGWRSRRSASTMMCSDISMSLMTPNWSCSIQPHILAETMVGMAQGTSTAARTMARPVKVGVQHQRDDDAEDRLDRHRDEREPEVL